MEIVVRKMLEQYFVMAIFYLKDLTDEIRIAKYHLQRLPKK